MFREDLENRGEKIEVMRESLGEGCADEYENSGIVWSSQGKGVFLQELRLRSLAE